MEHSTDLKSVPMSDALMHYGVKGMKWGVRKDRKTGKIKPGSVLRRAPLQRRDDLMKATATKSLHTRATFQDQSDQLKKVYKSARPKIKAGLKKLNADSKYAGVNLNEKKNKKLRDDYNKEVSRVVTDQLNAASYVKTKRKDPFAVSFEYRSGVSEKPIVSIAINDKKAFRDSNRKWAKETRKSVKHSEDDSVVKFELVLDENGFVTDLVELTSMTQSNDLGSVLMSDLDKDALMHHGVKGMKWGVRKSRSAKYLDRAEKGGGKKRKNKLTPAQKERIKKAKIKAKADIKVAKLNAKAKKIEARTKLESAKAKAESSKAQTEAPKKKAIKDMTNQELQEIINRNRLETEYKKISQVPKKKTTSDKIVEFAVKQGVKGAERASGALVNHIVDTQMKKIIGESFKPEDKKKKDKS